MVKLEICLFGGFTATLDKRPITKFRSAKSRALLAYLATEPAREHERTILATLLWGDSAERAAKTNLRIELSNLKKVLGNHPALTITRNTVSFQGATATVDVRQFQQLVTHFLSLPIESQLTALAHLKKALHYYQGEFLAGFQINDAQAFEEWQLLMREQLHEEAMRALELLQRRHAEQSNWAELASAARRQLALVPWQETAHRNLIQALAAQGDTVGALTQYERCHTILHTELGVEPALATQEIVARLRAKGAQAQEHVAQHNLPQQLKTMVGRVQEQKQVYELVQEHQLVTLLGFGGVGKSRLALAVAQQAIHHFADGVWFVSLANVSATASAPSRIALAIAGAIGYAITDMQMPLRELAAHIADKEMLLILDNWDELTAAAEELCASLLVGSRLHLLATSRVRLLVEGERVVPLEGLPPEEAATLFIERAQRIVPNFAAEQQRTAIEQVCAAVAGLPLGIELAAGWVEHFTVAEIGQSLTQIAAAPQLTDEHVARHQTLAGVFAYSWQLLNPGQQQLLARLTIFRGGFDRAAVDAVAEGNVSDLSMLIVHSLVQRLSAGRYDLHPLVREFAMAKLSPTAHATLAARHSHHYLKRLATVTHTDLLHADFDNVRCAWQQAVAAGERDILEPVVVRFGEFTAQFSYLPDAYRLFSRAVAKFEPSASTHKPQHDEFVAHLLDQQWHCARPIHGLQQAEQYLQRLLVYTRDTELLIKTYLELATKHAEAGAWEEVEQTLAQVERLTQTSTDPHIYVPAIEGPIHIRAIHFRGDYAAGIQQLKALLAWLDTLPDSAFTTRQTAADLRMRVLQSLALVAMRYGDYALGIAAAKENLSLFDSAIQRPKRSWVLLDLALAEQFAGFFQRAIRHNQEALAIAEETGAIDDIGLLKANLCLTLRQAGDLEGALRYGEEAVAALLSIGLARMEGQARNRVGHTLLAMSRWSDAAATYGAALTLWAALAHPNQYEALAGQAVAHFELGNQDQALVAAQTVWAFVRENGLAGIVEPALLLAHCAKVLLGCQKLAEGRAVLAAAQRWIQQIADRISNTATRTAFYAKPEHQRLAAMIEQLP